MEKKLFCLLETPPKHTSFLTIPFENICFKNQGRRLCVIVTPTKGLE